MTTEITLQKLALENFKGVKKFVFEPKGRNATIKGDHQKGKSTIMDAISFLFFDKDREGRDFKKFSIKKRDAKGQSINDGQDHSVRDNELGCSVAQGDMADTEDNAVAPSEELSFEEKFAILIEELGFVRE